MFVLLIFLIGSLIGGSNAIAAEFVESNGRHPVFALFGVPTVTNLETKNRLSNNLRWNRMSVSIDHSNIFAGGVLGDERLLLDGESSRISAGFSFNIASCWSVAADIPYVAHHSGGLDELIERWHDVFQLPTSKRELTEQDVLRYEYSLGGREFVLGGASSSFGDLSLQLHYQPNCSSASGVIYRFGLKLPTGDLEHWSGSGSTDYFAEINSPSMPWRDKWSAKMRLGIAALGQSSELTQLRPLVLFGTATLGYQLKANLSLATQIDWHSPLFDSELTELGSWTAQLGAALQWKLNDRDRLEMGFQEDLVVDTSPDIVFHLNYRRYVR